MIFADHIPKTPGPAVVSDKESEDQSNDEKEDEEVKGKSDNESDSDSDSDSSSSHSDSSNDNNKRNDSEVERSDNENDDNEEGNEKTAAHQEKEDNEDNDDGNDEENEDKEEDDNEGYANKIAVESQDNDSEDDEEVQRKASPQKKRQLENNSDSSDDESSDEHKKQRKESVDKEDNEENEDKDEDGNDKTAEAKDIFGEMSSEDEEDTEKRKHIEDEERDSDRQSVDENNERKNEESGDEDNVIRGEMSGEQTFAEDEEPVEEPIPETRIEVEIPRIVADLGREVHFVKLPNFLSIDTHPYDPQWYEDEIDEDENLDDEGRARLKLKVENTIRWRNVLDKETNELKRESNTRVVRWSDGTFSLHLGEEIFDIHKLQLMTGDNNHLFIRQGTGLQGQTVFRTKLNFRPFSTESFTHRKLTLSLADRSQKTQKIRVLPNVGKDPEAHRTEMIKKEEDRLKASIRRENKQRRVRERSSVRGPTASYLEPDEDEEEGGISISKIKEQFKRGSFAKYDEPESSPEDSKQANDDDSDDDLFERKEKKRRAAHIDESDDE